LTAVQDEVSRGTLAFRPIVYPELLSTCAIVFRRAAPAAIVAEFANIARIAMTTLVDTGAWPGAQIIKSVRRPVVPLGAIQADRDPSEIAAGSIAN
jgi:hypothetical protein